MSNVTGRQLPHSQSPAGWPTTTNAAVPTTQPYPVVRMPTVSPAAAEILRDAVWHIDAAEHQANGANPKTVRNLGWGGSILNARCGSTTVSDTNDPLHLGYWGTPYVYLPGIAGNSLTCTAPATATQYLATALDGTTASGAATGGTTFTFSTTGSWATVSLLDAGSAVVASFIGANLTTGSAATQTDAYGVAWTINRATSGRKSVAVVAPVWLFGTDDYMSVPGSATGSKLLDFSAQDSFTIMAMVRQWPTLDSGGEPLISKRSSATVAGTPGYNLRAVGGGTPGQKVFDIYDGAIRSVVFGSIQSAGVARLIYGTRSKSGLAVGGVIGASDIVFAADTSGHIQTSSALYLGVLSPPAGGYIPMEFMSAAIFRRALSASEIATLTTYLTGKCK